MLTFDQWRNERRTCEDLREEKDVGLTSYDEDGPIPGFIYPGGLYIESVTDRWSQEARDQGKFYLIIERDEWIGSLYDLEWTLYQYARKYGHLDGVEPTRPVMH